jgi:rubredoxin
MRLEALTTESFYVVCVECAWPVSHYRSGALTHGSACSLTAQDYWSSTPGVPMPESQCDGTAQKLCGRSKSTGGEVQCGVCAALHMSALVSAGCTSSDVAEFCTAAPPADDSWICGQCQHVYNPATDDPAHRNTPFEQLPESWRCPVCGAPKSAYRKRTDSVTGEAQWFHEE